MQRLMTQGVELGVGVRAGKGPNTRLGTGFTFVLLVKYNG